MPVNSTHPEYDAALPEWLRARDVIAGEEAVKAAGLRYLPPLDAQTDEEYEKYLARASFFNATARTAQGFVGLIFRRLPFIKLPEEKSALGTALSVFKNDADMLGTPLVNYAKNVVNEVIAVGRAGTLIDWESDVENRVYASLYDAENILNWRVERINGRNIPTLIVLHESCNACASEADDVFASPIREQIRVLKLVEDVSGKMPNTAAEVLADSHHALPMKCVVEIWRPKVLADTRYTGDATNEPALFLTDQTALIQSTNAFMGRLSTLLKWSAADPVDVVEQLRNDLVYSLHQTNRNPFVDHPEWVNAAFAPALAISFDPQQSTLTLSWSADYTGCALEAAPAVPGATWTTITNAPIQTNSTWRPTIPVSEPSLLFRLRIY